MVEGGLVKKIIMSVAACLKNLLFLLSGKVLPLEIKSHCPPDFPFLFLQSKMSGIYNDEVLDPLSILAPHEALMLIIAQT